MIHSTISSCSYQQLVFMYIVMCALVGILCVWWRGSAVSFGGACRAIREVVRWSWKGWVVVVVFVAVVPGVKGVDDYPNAAAKAACDVWAEAQTTTRATRAATSGAARSTSPRVGR